ncbi:MAG: pantothenate kinase [Oscillospiraceae bacterium]|jgi:type II pantothenate kinase|nr:pantothenate kinase [Oscillospiraceae bacterium]
MLQIGIDVGGSTTKLVGQRPDGSIFGMTQVRAADQVTSLYGAIGTFCRSENVQLSDIAEIAITGVGAQLFEDSVYGIPLRHIDEFKAIGRGGLLLSGLDAAIVVSCGTGTAFVRASGDKTARIGGIGIGGGTLMGLSHLLLREDDIHRVSDLASRGNGGNVDLLMSAISREAIPGLPDSATASNFGAVNPTTSREDLALGITNLVTHSVGMLAVFATLNDPDGIRDIVLTGSVAELPQCAAVMTALTAMTGVRFRITENAPYATAIGALAVVG